MSAPSLGITSFGIALIGAACSRPPENRLAPQPRVDAGTEVAPVRSAAPPEPAPGSPSCGEAGRRREQPVALFSGMIAYRSAHAEGLYLAGDRVLVTTAGHALLAPTTGGAATLLGFEESHEIEAYDAATPHTYLIGLATSFDKCAPPGVHAYDPVTLERRWTYDPKQPLERVSVQGVEIGRRLALAFRDFASRAWRVATLDLGSGKELWSLSGSGELALDSNGAALLTHQGSRVVALDPALGKQLWTVELPAGDLEGRFSPRFGVFVDRDLEKASRPRWIVDLQAPGGPRWRRETDPPSPARRPFAYLPSGGELFVEATANAQGAPGTKVVALDAATGKRRWSTNPVPCGSPEGYGPAVGFATHLAATDTTLYACTCDGVLRAFERATGALRGELGVGRCSELVVHNDVVVHWSLESHASESDLAFYHPGIQSEQAFAAPVQTTSISGQIEFSRGAARGPRRIRVGSSVVWTDAAGRFKVRVQGRGMISANVILGLHEEAEADYRTLLIGAAPEQSLTLPLARGIVED